MERFSETRRWFAQAMRDLKAAIDSLNAGNYEWSCFQAQQAAEKAVKALLYAHGRSPWGHSVVELLEEVKDLEDVEEDLFTQARELDRHYIPSRYPNAFESGYPAMYYDRIAAERAINASNTIIRWVRERLESIGVKL